MTALQKLFNHLCAAVAVDLLVCVTIAENVVAGEFIYVILLNFAFLACGSWYEILIKDGAVISEWVGMRQRSDFFLIFADAPRLNVFVFVDEGTESNSNLYLFVCLLHNG